MRALALALALVSGGGCADDDLHPAPWPDDPPLDTPVAASALTCRADARSFVQRAMPLLHGRRPLGSAEVRLLAAMVDDLEARGRDGRRQIARGLAEGEDYRRRWGSELLDLLRTRRAGHRVLTRCYGQAGPAAKSEALAHFVRDHPPTEPFAGGSWTMRDLVESSLRADDLRPILRADLLVRMTAPIDDDNTAPDDLERSRRINFGRSFEAAYLGRRFECLGCHRDDASVTDHDDPALDRFWPAATGIERAVYPADEESMHAVFRWEGFADGELAPWGSEGCGTFSLDRATDPLPTTAALGGPLPPGATALDLQARLDEGLEQLAAEGWSPRPPDGARALAQLVVLHLVDGVWASAVGHRLTLDHGTPRNAAQSERLRTLAITLVRSHYSLRALLVEIATDPYVDQAVPAHCELDGPEPLPAVFDPFATLQIGPGTNGVGHAVHRHDPFALLDHAHRLLGRALPGLLLGQDGFDPVTAGALGAYLRESEPGHEGLDLFGLLRWEEHLAALPDAAPAAPDAMALTLDDLVTAAGEDPSLSVGDLMIAIKDRILADPTIDADERALIQALIEHPWDRPAHELAAGPRRAAALAYARLLMATPQFLLAGLEQASAGAPPRLRLPPLDPATLCETWGPRLLPDEPWICSDRGLVLP
ncbi:MAG: hypothetical protein AAGF11_06125 [Myxococcota bacterium]